MGYKLSDVNLEETAVIGQCIADFAEFLASHLPVPAVERAEKYARFLAGMDQDEWEQVTRYRQEKCDPETGKIKIPPLPSREDAPESRIRVVAIRYRSLLPFAAKFTTKPEAAVRLYLKDKGCSIEEWGAVQDFLATMRELKVIPIRSRVQVLPEDGWPGSPTGTIVYGPTQKMTLRNGSQDWFYCVKFEEPTQDTSPDGPYTAAEILSQYLIVL